LTLEESEYIYYGDCRDTFSIFNYRNLERYCRTRHTYFDLNFSTNFSLQKNKLKTIKLKLNQEQPVFKNQNKLGQNVTILFKY